MYESCFKGLVAITNCRQKIDLTLRVFIWKNWRVLHALAMVIEISGKEKIREQVMINTISSFFGFILLLFILMISALNGYLNEYVQAHILFAYMLVFCGLCFITFGIRRFSEVFCSVRFIWKKDIKITTELLNNIKITMQYSYTASFTWILGYIASGFLFDNNTLSASAISDIAVSLLYGFIVSELFLRPIYNKLKSIHLG